MVDDKIPPTIFISARTLPDAWARAVKKVMSVGTVIETEHGPLSRDVCSLIEVREPFREPMLHPQFPTKTKHLKEYIEQWRRDYNWVEQGFEYNYMNRLIEYGHYTVVSHGRTVHDVHLNYVDQIKYMRKRLSEKIVSRRVQAIIWRPNIDTTIKNPPCLQRIWIRYLDNDRVELHCSWRSRDLYNAWNTNLIAMLDMINREILEPCSLQLVKLVDYCDSLHIYEADWTAAKNVRHVIKSPQENYKT